MLLWHLTSDAPRSPHRVSPDDWVTLDIGTWAVEPGQAVWVEVHLTRADGSTTDMRADAEWRHNAMGNSYWRAELPPFARGNVVRYQVRGLSPAGGVDGPARHRARAGRYMVLENWGAFIVEPVDSTTSRLLVRTRGSGYPTPLATVLGPLGLLVFEPAHFIMERKMMLRIKELAKTRRVTMAPTDYLGSR